ncbi:heparinase II/III domain-containing protein [Microbulbifer thermotolerans]|nr:heparinase II/III family protein [Microbulbifer thermotolerans]MCX2833009.1 heparinase II/III family protein [Microbulbifer thermotolerans]
MTLGKSTVHTPKTFALSALTAGIAGAFCLVAMTWSPLAASATSPNLVINAADVDAMQGAVSQPGRFRTAFLAVKADVDAFLTEPFSVPLPTDAGGGYSHEQHKKNYRLMYDAGVLYQITGERRYADRVRDMLLAYAKMYPDLPLHPKRRPGAKNPGKLFWQSLNEAVWLVYTIQAYDLIRPSLSKEDARKIENGVLRPVARFLSEESPATFNKVHNHGTWLTAAVGMTGYVLDEPEWVEKALLGLDKSGKGGFLRQLAELFSPDGYYTEGPYYQRYALMPFVTFAKAIDNNQPERDIFGYRDRILLKAVDSTIQLSYNGRFFPINDAIKNKGIDTPELVLGVAISYGKTGDARLLDIARRQGETLLTGDGLKVAQDLDANKQTAYPFTSWVFRDGAKGDQGALVVLRQQAPDDQALVFKPTAQGMGHGHFDKLSWQFYDSGAEVVTDYGAARFLNVEAKNGGRYLPENESYAKQTIAHNTLVIDERSHFDGNLKIANQKHPELLFFHAGDNVKISSAAIDSAYPGVTLKRTMALVQTPDHQKSFAIDLFDVQADRKHQLDLPLHYNGQLIDTNFNLYAYTDKISALGSKNGYQHLWLRGRGEPEQGLAQITWLNDNGRFYTYSSLVDGDIEILFTELGANDPNFNLRSEKAFLTRRANARAHTFVGVLEPHGEYDPAREFTAQSESQIVGITHKREGTLQLLSIALKDGSTQLLAFNDAAGITDKSVSHFDFDGNQYTFRGRAELFSISDREN